jgi:hypothetical protein
VFHRLRFGQVDDVATLAVSREALARTGLSINKIVKPCGRGAPPRSPSAVSRSSPNRESRQCPADHYDLAQGGH